MGVGPSWLRIWISPTPARPVERSSDVGTAPDACAGPSQGCRPVGSGRPLWEWPPTPVFGLSRSIPGGPPSGATVLVDPLRRTTRSPIAITRHHAAAVVIARRGQGVGARRRQGVAGRDQRIVAGELPARPDERLPDHQGPGPPGGQRAAAVVPRKTRPGSTDQLGDQVAQDRSGPPGGLLRPAQFHRNGARA
jgi:hypothetical protein